MVWEGRNLSNTLGFLILGALGYDQAANGSQSPAVEARVIWAQYSRYHVGRRYAWKLARWMVADTDRGKYSLLTVLRMDRWQAGILWQVNTVAWKLRLHSPTLFLGRSANHTTTGVVVHHLVSLILCPRNQYFPFIRYSLVQSCSLIWYCRFVNLSIYAFVDPAFQRILHSIWSSRGFGCHMTAFQISINLIVDFRYASSHFHATRANVTPVLGVPLHGIPTQKRIFANFLS